MPTDGISGVPYDEPVHISILAANLDRHCLSKSSLQCPALSDFFLYDRNPPASISWYTITSWEKFAQHDTGRIVGSESENVGCPWSIQSRYMYIVLETPITGTPFPSSIHFSQYCFSYRKGGISRTFFIPALSPYPLSKVHPPRLLKWMEPKQYN